ncbi:MAG: ATP-dependent Clp protease adaptor ClpS [Acidobacteriota bacterium]
MSPLSDHRPREEQEIGTAIAPRERVEVQEPRPYRVLLHNDDYTTMDFVVEALVSIFGRSVPEATRIMLQVHHDGIGTAGIYPRDIAETKAGEMEAAAQSQGMPLRVSTEPVSEE